MTVVERVVGNGCGREEVRDTNLQRVHREVVNEVHDKCLNVGLASGLVGRTGLSRRRTDPRVGMV